ncbi:unnamed protein product [Citrullus colocynthis]|uniref:Uncharacterized protein n=1 Tax=Citrullus colocynthis TaxID=252529 RepID=A0ABP0Z0U8_9ROSI
MKKKKKKKKKMTTTKKSPTYFTSSNKPDLNDRVQVEEIIRRWRGSTNFSRIKHHKTTTRKNPKLKIIASEKTLIRGTVELRTKLAFRKTKKSNKLERVFNLCTINCNVRHIHSRLNETRTWEGFSGKRERSKYPIEDEQSPRSQKWRL